jgi:hypothetical protein
VLAVGDAPFQKRCQERILQLKADGKTIVFISHDLAAVRQVCDRSLLLNHGRLVGEGTPSDVIANYARLGGERLRKEEDESLHPNKAAWITALTFFDGAGQPTTELSTSRPVRAVVEYQAAHNVPGATINLLFYSSGDWTVASHFSTSGASLDLQPGTGAIEFCCDELTLGPGAYSASCSVDDRRGEIDFVTKTYFSVAADAPIRGRFHSPHRWRQMARHDA